MKLDLEKGEVLFRAGNIFDAAKLGLPVAQGIIASRFLVGSDGFEEDLNEAFMWAYKAAKGGDALGQHCCGLCYHKGFGVVIDLAESLNWYKRAADQIWLSRSASMNNIGMIYFKGGPGVEQDLEEAVSWFRESAQLDDEDAQFMLGTCYLKGDGIAKNLESARKWLEMAGTGHAEAQYYLGLMVIQGDGGAKVRTDGLSLVEQAASANSQKAIQFLSELDKLVASEFKNQMDK